jgi:hypothetical protein
MNLKPDLKQAARFIDVLTGRRDPIVCWQVFDDSGRDRSQAEHRHGRLSDKAIQEWLTTKTAKGCGVFVVVNRTDGTGRRRDCIVSSTAVFADLDKGGRPNEYRLPPSLIVESSPNKFHLYWLIERTRDLDAWLDAQALVAAAYNGDRSMVDTARVLRVPGFYHRKTAKPFMSRVVQWPAPFELSPLAEVRKAHDGIDYEAAPPAKAQVRQTPANVEMDTPANKERGRQYLAALDKPVEGDRNNSTYAAACRLRDMALSADVRAGLLAEWNDALPDPLPQAEVEHVNKSADLYGRNAPGSDTAEADFENDEADAEAGDQAAAQLKAMPVLPRLDKVTRENINSVFKFVNLGGKPRVLYWGRSPLDKRMRVPQFMTVADFKMALVNKTYSKTITSGDNDDAEKTVVVNIANEWLKSKRRRIYDGVVLQLEMDSASPESINLWRGYGVTPSPAGDWSLLRGHIREIVADGKAERYEYILRWIAWALQNPHLPAEVALVLKSEGHGTGKGILLRAIRKLFGVHGLQISKAGLLTGRFNSHLAMCCLLFVDEMTLGDNKETATLNSTLTEDVLAIEPKGVDAYQMPNHVKVVCASNQDHVVHLADSDRRFAVFNVSEQRAQDHAYFNHITQQLEAGGYARMLHDLLAIDLEGFHPRQLPRDLDNAPEKVNSAPPEIEWLAGYLDSGVLDCQVDGRGGIVVHAHDLYEQARRSHRRLAGWSDIRFASFLKEWRCTRRRSNGTLWEFPDLQAMRKAFRKRFPWWPAFEAEVDTWHDACAIEHEIEAPALDCGAASSREDEAEFEQLTGGDGGDDLQ